MFTILVYVRLRLDWAPDHDWPRACPIHPLSAALCYCSNYSPQLNQNMDISNHT